MSEDLHDFLSCLQRMIHDSKNLVVLSVTLFFFLHFHSSLIYSATGFDVFYYDLQIYQNINKKVLPC